MISFRGKGLSGAGLAEIVGDIGFAGTTVLDLKECAVGDEGLRALAASEHAYALGVLWADGVGATDIGARALADSPFISWRELYLGFNAISGEGVGALAKGRATAQLQILRLGGNPIGDDGARALAASPSMRNLEILFLSKAGLTDDGLLALAGSPHLRSLDSLDVTLNSITAGGLATLLESGHLPALTTLHVDASLADNALKALAARARPSLSLRFE